jgi:hypothetical protein
VNRGVFGGLAVAASLVSTLARAHTPEGLAPSDLDERALEPQLYNVERDLDERWSVAVTAPLWHAASPTYEGFFKPAFGASVNLYRSDVLSLGFGTAIERSDHLEVVLPLAADTELGPLALRFEAAYHVLQDVDEVTLDVGFELPLWRDLSMIALVKGAATPRLEEPSLRTAAGFSWKSSETLSITALAGDAVRDVPFETSEQLFMLAARANW